MNKRKNKDVVVRKVRENAVGGEDSPSIGDQFDLRAGPEAAFVSTAEAPNLRRHVDRPATKLRTRVDKLGGHNPTWNDKFLFGVTKDFLSGATSSVCVTIYAVGTFRDHLVGTVRFLISNMFSPEADDATPCFSAFQIRRPSGRFHGVMNIGAMVMDGSGFPALEKISAIGYRDLMGEKIHQRRRKTLEEQPKEEEGESWTASPSSSARTTAALKDWNRVRELAGNKGLAMSASGFLCCLVTQRSLHQQQLTPTHHHTLESKSQNGWLKQAACTNQNSITL